MTDEQQSGRDNGSSSPERGLCAIFRDACHHVAIKSDGREIEECGRISMLEALMLEGRRYRIHVVCIQTEPSLH